MRRRANAGYRCLLVAYKNGDGAVLMTSSDSGDAVVRSLLTSIAREYEWPDYCGSSHVVSRWTRTACNAAAGRGRKGRTRTAQLGAVQSVTFKSVGPVGDAIY